MAEHVDEKPLGINDKKPTSPAPPRGYGDDAPSPPLYNILILKVPPFKAMGARGFHRGCGHGDSEGPCVPDIPWPLGIEVHGNGECALTYLRGLVSRITTYLPKFIVVSIGDFGLWRYRECTEASRWCLYLRIDLGDVDSVAYLVERMVLEAFVGRHFYLRPLIIGEVYRVIKGLGKVEPRLETYIVDKFMDSVMWLPMLYAIEGNGYLGTATQLAREHLIQYMSESLVSKVVNSLEGLLAPLAKGMSEDWALLVALTRAYRGFLRAMLCIAEEPPTLNLEVPDNNVVVLMNNLGL